MIVVFENRHPGWGERCFAFSCGTLLICPSRAGEQAVEIKEKNQRKVSGSPETRGKTIVRIGRGLTTTNASAVKAPGGLKKGAPTLPFNSTVDFLH